jgi:hypothetical protein
MAANSCRECVSKSSGLRRLASSMRLNIWLAC